MEYEDALHSEYEHHATIMIGMIIRIKPIRGIIKNDKYDIQKST